MEIEEEKGECIGNVKIEYFNAYFGERKGYFIPKLIALENGKKYSFNIGAFFFGIFWFLYRRLYIQSLIILIITIIASLIRKSILLGMAETRDLDISLRFIWTIILGVVLGYLGNYLFLMNSNKKVVMIISSTDDETSKLRKLRKAGSGNWILVLSIIFVLALGLIFGRK